MKEPWFCFNWAESTVWLDRHKEAATLIEESQVLFRGLNEDWGLADALHLKGGIALRSGKYKLAIERFSEAQHLYERLGEKRSIALYAIMGW